MKIVQTKRCETAQLGLYSLEPPRASKSDRIRTERTTGRRWLIGFALGLLLAFGSLGGCDGGTGQHGSGQAAASADESGAREPTTEAAESLRENRPTIVFLGTSLTAGYGLREDQAFPALVERRFEADGRNYRVVNAGVSGDTSAGGLRRLEWLLRLPIAVLVVELGANDMLRGQSVDALESNLATILDRTKSAHPNVRFLIAGMRAAPNLGGEYRDRFDAVYPELADRFGAALVPFLLEDVAAKGNLNQADGIHPTAEGHALIADRVYRALDQLLPR